MKNKRAITMFRKFYPATVKAMGGAQGLKRWLVGDDPMPTHAARVFRAENERLFREAAEFDEVSNSDVMRVFCDALPSIA